MPNKRGLQWPVSICRRHTALLMMLASPRGGAWCGSVPRQSGRIGPNGWVMKNILPAWSGLPITHLSNGALLVFRIMSYSQEPKKYANFKRIATMFKYDGKNKWHWVWTWNGIFPFFWVFLVLFIYSFLFYWYFLVLFIYSFLFILYYFFIFIFFWGGE